MTSHLVDSSRYYHREQIKGKPEFCLNQKYQPGFIENYSHRQRRLRFEYKSFSFKIDNGGASVTIVEEVRHQKFLVSIDFGGVDWMIQNLKKAKNQFNEVNFFSKYQASYALFLLQRYNNNKGSFISLLRLHQGVVKNVVSFPSGVIGEGWLEIAKELHCLLHDPPTQQRVAHWRTSRAVQEALVSKGHGKAPTRDKGYVEKKIELDKENSKRISKERGKSGDDWGHIVVCTRENLWDSWGDIQKSLSKFINNRVNLTPFQPDKALFYCEDEEEANSISKKKIVNIPGSFKVILLGWKQQEDQVWNKKVSCTGGWIEVEDLPLRWWTSEVFEAIGSKCGGLIQIHQRTEKMQQLFKARLKIKGNPTGFIPSEIDMEVGEEEFTVRLRAISKLNFKCLERRKLTTDVLDFCRCSINLPGEDDQSGKFQSDVEQSVEVRSKEEQLGNMGIEKRESEVQLDEVDED
ncbi:hypothetical protein LguiB_027182 [Lonicera macranthoides]